MMVIGIKKATPLLESDYGSTLINIFEYILELPIFSMIFKGSYIPKIGMQFEENKGLIRKGELVGFTFACLIFVSILYYILSHLGIVHVSYWIFFLIGLTIAGVRFNK